MPWHLRVLAHLIVPTCAFDCACWRAFVFACSTAGSQLRLCICSVAPCRVSLPQLFPLAVALGLVPYVKDPWNDLDAVVVIASIVSLGIAV